MKLKPCPMCGPGKSIVELYKDDYKHWRIACGACGLHSGIIPDNNKERLIKQWNQRSLAEDSRGGDMTFQEWWAVKGFGKSGHFTTEELMWVAEKAWNESEKTYKVETTCRKCGEKSTMTIG